MGIKQTAANPWVDFAARFPLGTCVEGKVSSVMDYGIFVTLEV
ncbi:MAG: hypothetical protein R3C68_16265 [Myxococcota bacterium]